MSKHETWRTRKYWESVGGTLIEEFQVVKKGKDNSRRLLDGLIIIGGPTEIYQGKEKNIQGKDVICIQTKANRLGMYLLGQAFFSKELLKAHNPKSIKTVAIVSTSDSVLESIAKEFGIEVVVVAN